MFRNFWILNTFVVIAVFWSSLAIASSARLEPTADGEWNKTVFTFGTGLSTFLVSQFALPVPKTCRWCVPVPFERELALNTRWVERKGAGLFSSVIAYGVMPGIAGLVALYDYENPSNSLLDAFTVLNTVLLNYSVTEVFKRGSARARPYSTLGDETFNVDDEYMSFPSGHTSLVFALTTASTIIAFKRHYNWAPFVLFLGGLASIGTGYFRMAAGAHWFSDVIAGAALGTFVGAAVPLFTFTRLSPMPRGRGLLLSWDW